MTPRAPRRPSLSLAGKLSLVFFSIPALAIAAIYLYVAPGLQTRLINSKLQELRSTATSRTTQLRASIGSSTPLREVRRLGMAISESTSNRVMLLAVNEVGGRPQLVIQMDSAAGMGGGVGLSPTATRLALRGVHTRRVTTGTVRQNGAVIAEAVEPVAIRHRVVAVIVLTTPVADVLRTVTTVRREILIAGGLALLLALLAGMAVARALARRVRRLERAAQQMAAGHFGEPIPVDSADELGQLAAAFNEMQSQLLAFESARKRFIATASHELRTPIFSVGGFLELLEDEDLDPETRRRFLDQIRDQVRRLGKLSVDLLDLSRLESGSLELRPEDVDLGELARSVAGEFEPTIALKEARLELSLPSGLDATCDPIRVAQIVRILLDNALTHTPSGTVVAVRGARAGPAVRISVTDDGDGIDPATAERIFEPFFTGGDGAAGSGLGLAIASELAGRMRGSLTVRTGSPRGTTFTLELPATG
ncbi:MAG TPA: HAMP domain-containing sensor histidine kinase [Solirubrobacteraceae bacterium]|nr:HAMP domain-containing sensor histidine kinase [Solirubrobacteraceae bacterium]